MFPSLEQLIQDKSMAYVKGSVQELPRGALPGDPRGLLDKRILLRRGGALGDVLFVTSVASTIKAKQRRCFLALACPEWIAPLVRRVPEVDQVLAAKESCRKGVWEGFDFLIDFGGVIERDERAAYTDYFSLHLERAGIDKWPLVFPRFSFPKGSRNYVAIHVGGSNEKKKWPIGFWEELLQMMDKRGIVYVLLGDSGDDHPTCVDSSRDLIGSTSLEEACRVVFGAALFVGTDSGLLHFAGMAGVPTFSLWGAFEPRLTVPHYRDARFIQSMVECAPCSVLQKEACEHGFRCMSSLKPKDVWTKLWNCPSIHYAIRRDSVSSIISVPPAMQARQEVELYFGGEKVEGFADGPFEVSILIPNRNTKKFLPNLFASLSKNTGDEVRWETVLCTNGEGPYLHSGGKEVVLSEAAGYAGANNVAYRFASKNSEFICLLNADIEVEEGWLKPLVDFLREHPDAGIVGCKQLRFNGKIESLGSRWDWRSKHFPHIGYGHLSHPEQDKVCEREMVTFSSVLIRREVWEQVGGIDEEYAAGYWEDTDFCMKARQLGWRIFCVPQSVVRHHVGGSRAFPPGGRAQTKRIFKKRWVDTGLVDKFRHQMGIRHIDDRVVACYIVLNEEEFIQASLESIYDFVDKIVIVEGGNDFAVKAGLCGPDKRSSDRTVELIRDFEDPDGKIELVQGDWKDKVEQRNAYARFLEPGDWMLLMDGDEVFLEDGLWRASALMHSYDVIRPGFYLFWNNFHTLGTSVWEEYLQVKLVHWRKGYHYVDHNCPSTAQGRLVSRDTSVRKWVCGKERLYCHYSWVKPLDKLRAKVEYYRHQGGHPPVIRDYFDKVFLAWRKDPVGVERRYGTHLFGAGETRHFEGKHPEPIQRRLDAGVFDWG